MADGAMFAGRFLGDETRGEESAAFVEPLLMDGEEVIFATKGMRDGAVFTNRRIMVINRQGISGKKVEVASIALKSISLFTVENSGTFDLDAEVKIYGSGFGCAELNFTKGFDVKKIGKYLAACL